jgi:hypothetical protein
MIDKLMQIFVGSSEEFLQSATNLIMSGVSERCLCGSFMLIIRNHLNASEFSSYYTDIEYNRNFDGQIKTIIDDNMQVTNITCQ